MTRQLIREARRVWTALLGVMLVLTAYIGFPAAPAWAISEPVYDAARDVPPPDGTPVVPIPMEQFKKCMVSGLLENSQLNSSINTVLEVSRLHGFATGKGQTVAVIDSGVNRNVRLPNLIGGGDYVLGGDGLEDCDHHGTLVAGIVAAAPSPDDSFVGMAPDAGIISIRQTSEAYRPIASERPNGYDAAAESASNLHTLAQAIVHAANMGATVINMSVTACFPASTPMDMSALAGALYYAAVEKNIVVVASAGNTGSTSSACKQNPGPSPASPGDPRGWGTVETISLPSMWSQFVLSVGGTDLNGVPYDHTMGGPWVGVGSPAVNVTSLNPVEGDKGTLVNAQWNEDRQLVSINGTSFAAPYVSGLAALIREKYPNLTTW